MATEKLIQGKTPGSIEEWNVAIALTQLKIEFVYQIPLFGGYGIRGGMILDFLLINPFPQALEVFGEYWHQSDMKARDQLRLNILTNYYKREVIVLWGSEVQTIPDAIEAVKREVPT